MLHTVKALTLRLCGGLLVCLPFATPSSADVAGFQAQYYAEVDGATWGLQLERSKTFMGVVMGHLLMGDANNRLVLMGSPDNGTIQGTYKPFFKMGSGNKAFSLARRDDQSAVLILDDLPGFPAQGVTFMANANNATLDNSLLGVWRTEPEFGLRSDEPYTAAQWVVEFKEDGTLCRHQFFIDTRTDKPTGSACAMSDSKPWKVDKNQILMKNDYGSWEHIFSYRIMSEHLFLSYPGNDHRDIFSRDEETVARH